MDGGKGHGKIHQAVNFQMNRREKNILGGIGPLDRKPNDSGSAQAIPSRAIVGQLILPKITLRLAGRFAASHTSD